MDENWALKCVSETTHILAEKFPNSDKEISSAVMEICLTNLDQAMSAVVLSVISLSFSLATLFLGWINFTVFMKYKKPILIITTLVSLGTSIWGLLINGAWYFWLTLGGAMLITLIYFVIGIVKEGQNKLGENSD